MDVRTQILDAATRLFASQGVGATSIGAIADEVGIKKPSLLYHFPSKDELHRAVIDRVIGHFRDVLPRLLSAAASERFEALLHATVDFFLEEPDRARLLLREALDRPDAMRAQLKSGVAPWIDVLAAQIEQGQAAGVLRADVDPQAYLLQVIHLIVASVATADTLGALLGERGKSDRARLIRELERLARTSLFSPAELSRTSASRTSASRTSASRTSTAGEAERPRKRASRA
ncbi:MAG: TetR/AcrR family transcriptional regulator [Sandaracinaceae bacterium]|nr:TetR/AcrR family transcriptional regulator [Sandaracinaceae bacterium]